MRCVVTGCAGFIGSHLAEALVGRGYQVVGIDCFTDYYPPEIKRRNLAMLLSSRAFTLIEADLLEYDLRSLLQGADCVFHQAAQAGVRTSWGRNFDVYTQNNVLATQRLLEAAKTASLERFVYASSSSIYGDAVDLPVTEDSLPRPVSPYGVTKLAAEHLCHLYWANFGVPTVSLRYFTVYGPRQRPDMGFNRFIRALLSNEEIVIYGDGEQTRDFTFVSDAVSANLACLESDVAGRVFNIGGGSRISVNSLLEVLQKASGIEGRIRHIENQKGDVRHTFADTSRAREVLAFKPSVGIEEGLRRQFEWQKAAGEERMANGEWRMANGE
ncbi:MAG: NAD-dependent epimerase/dehydratase family protein [Chloroflexi bacterium]|nr:NAD-dependent epimerase/dehydratase family protein [Chloroflexota bacterium]